MVAVTSYTLPPVQIVYHLATLVNVTSSVLSLDQSPPQQQITLPDGYVAYPDLGVAYKYSDHNATWIEARDICQKKGAQLAVMDSAEKMEFFIGRGDGWDILAGIIHLDGNWINVNTGSTLSSLPWKTGMPSGSFDCAFVGSNSVGLNNWPCNYSRTYACELPIRVSDKISAK